MALILRFNLVKYFSNKTKGKFILGLGWHYTHFLNEWLVDRILDASPHQSWFEVMLVVMYSYFWVPKQKWLKELPLSIADYPEVWYLFWGSPSFTINICWALFTFSSVFQFTSPFMAMWDKKYDIVDSPMKMKEQREVSGNVLTVCLRTWQIYIFILPDLCMSLLWFLSLLSFFIFFLVHSTYHLPPAV